MGSDGCHCKHPSHCKNVPAAGFIITRKDFIITPVQGPRKSCGCKKRKQPDPKIEAVDYGLIKSFVPPDDADIMQQRRFSTTTPLTTDKWSSGPVSNANKGTTALDASHPLRMPNLVLDDDIYASEINSIAPDARFMYEPHVHTSTKHGGAQQQHYHGGAPQEIFGVSHVGVSQVEAIRDSNQHHKHFTPRAVPQIEQLMDTLKRFEYMPPNMPNLSNLPSFAENRNLNQRFDGAAQYTDPMLRAEIRNLVRTAESEKKENRIWLVLVGLIHILQALLTTAAVLVYYLVWCYTQMMYFIMKSMLFFHNAEGSMKFAIGLVTVTSVFFAYSLVVKVERMFFRF